MPELPIVCTLHPDGLRARRESLADLARQAEPLEQIPDGVRLRFPASGDTLLTLARVVDAERQCCRFLRFTITAEPDGGSIGLEVTGPAGVREFVMSLFESG